MTRKPTLAEIRYFQVHGKLKKTPAPKTQEPEETSSALEDFQDFPRDSGGGWWELSTGKKVRNEEKAREEQAKIDGG